MMGNCEMARGHAAGGLAGLAMGPSDPPLTSGHSATLPRRALPRFTVRFPQSH